MKMSQARSIKLCGCCARPPETPERQEQMRTFRSQTQIRLGLLGLTFAAACLATEAGATKRHGSLIDAVLNAQEANHSYQVPAAGTVEVAFSPNEGSEALVLKVIDSSRRDLRVLAYSFTSVPVVSALLRAKKRGVDVLAEVYIGHFDRNLSRSRPYEPQY